MSSSPQYGSPQGAASAAASSSAFRASLSQMLGLKPCATAARVGNPSQGFAASAATAQIPEEKAVHHELPAPGTAQKEASYFQKHPLRRESLDTIVYSSLDSF